MRYLYILLLWLIISSGEASAYGTIAGTVTDTTGRPLVRATVRIIGVLRGAYTNSNGQFTIATIPSGSYAVVVNCVGYNARTDSATVRDDTTAVVNVRLAEKPHNDTVFVRPPTRNPDIQHRPTINREELQAIVLLQSSTGEKSYGTLAGSVTDTAGHPLVGATVLVEGTAKGSYTKKDGTFAIPQIPVGRWKIQIKNLGFEDISLIVKITKDTETEINCRLRYSASMTRCGPLSPNRLADPEIIGTIRIISSEELQHTAP